MSNQTQSDISTVLSKLCKGNRFGKIVEKEVIIQNSSVCPQLKILSQYRGHSDVIRIVYRSRVADVVESIHPFHLGIPPRPPTAPNASSCVGLTLTLGNGRPLDDGQLTNPISAK